MKLEDYWEKNLRNPFLLWIWWFKIIPMIELIYVNIWDFHVIVFVEKRFWLNHYRSKNSFFFFLNVSFWFGDWILVELVVLHVRNRYFVFCIVYLKRLTVNNEGDWERRGEETICLHPNMSIQWPATNILWNCHGLSAKLWPNPITPTRLSKHQWASILV